MQDARPSPPKSAIARIIAGLSNLLAGAAHAPEYQRRPVPPPEVGRDELLAIDNVHVLDVDAGRVRDERTVLVDGARIVALLRRGELQQLDGSRPVRIVDGGGRYLIPGLSDIHCHVSLVSEYGIGIRALRHFDSQRQRNCEAALEAGCTLVRDSGGAYAPVHWLKGEIDGNRLLGPRIVPSYEVLTPRGGMWDVGRIGNAMAPAMFGGPLLNFVTRDAEIERTLERIAALGAASFKTYFEERPLYGGKHDTRYRMFTTDQARLLRALADKHGKLLETHSMFTSGSRLVAEAGFDSVAHLTVDAPYDEALARTMAANGVAVVPTLSVGGYLAMNCGAAGFADHPDLRFFQELLETRVAGQIERCTVPELRPAYEGFRRWILQEIPERRMPMVGKVYPERVHGFAVHAAASLANLREAGVKIGVGTDGGTGLTFAGQLDVEIEALSHFGFSPAEILRMATLGNMEILKLDADFGSIAPGKYADLVLVDGNPLTDARNLLAIEQVFKGGRRLHAAHAGAHSLLC
jgi:imidazolonepropionase-like amidohydrolase